MAKSSLIKSSQVPPLFRQAFILASFLILVGTLTALTSGNLYFLILPTIVAFGLTFSASVGVCPMAMFMGIMPWNKSK